MNGFTYQPFTVRELSQVIFEALTPENLYSDAARNLLLGTCAQESHFGTYRKQITGPAIGIFQIEPRTFEWLQTKFKDRYPTVLGYQFHNLEFNDQAAALYCRLRYLADPKPLPPADDPLAIARYWKRVYNTVLGKGTVEEFLGNYKRFVGPLI